MIKGRMMRTAAFLFALAALHATVCLRAQSGEDAGDDAVTTQHSIHLREKTLDYSAHAGFLSLRDAQMKMHARMFYVSYTAGKPSDHRPLIFIWNGGPGSNAAMLELAAIGPRRLSSGTAGNASLLDNEESWLSFADLVFIDPVYAGYSYAATAEDQKQFLSDRGDAESFAEFIRIYRAHYQAQQQPVYLVGESYGSYRALGVADVLGRRGISVAGLFLISNLYNFSHGAELDAVFLLPNFTAAAFAHGKLTGNMQSDLQQAVHASEKFSLEQYLPALAAGDRLAADAKTKLADELANLTGVSAATWLAHDLRIDESEFATLLLGAQSGDYAAHYDTRMTGHAQLGAPYNVSQDPSLKFGVADAVEPYLRNELGWKRDAFYAGPWGGRWPTPQAPRGDWTAILWDWSTESRDRSPLLSSILERNPNLRMVIANGLFDFATPFAASEYDVAHAGLTPEQKARIRLIRYESGHSPYTSTAERVRLMNDAHALITATAGK